MRVAGRKRVLQRIIQQMFAAGRESACLLGVSCDNGSVTGRAGALSILCQAHPPALLHNRENQCDDAEDYYAENPALDLVLRAQNAC